MTVLHSNIEHVPTTSKYLKFSKAVNVFYYDNYTSNLRFLNASECFK